MRIEQDRLGQIKQWIYVGSSAVLFLVWVLSLAALTQKGSIDGRLAWVFGLCFLTIPMVIYQSLTPMWSRTARFSNPHAHSLVDGLLVVFWFTAWISLTSYVVSGKRKGINEKQSGCNNFAYGSPAKCKISEADIFFSVILMLCFIASSFFSFKVLMEYRRTGIAPNASYVGGGKVQKSNISYPQSYKAEDDAAFDSRLDVRNDGREAGYSFEAARVQGGAPVPASYGGPGESRPYAAGYESVPGLEQDGHDPNGRPLSFGGPLGSNRI